MVMQRPAKTLYEGSNPFLTSVSDEKKAQLSKWLHIGLAIFWTAMIPVSLLTTLKVSVPFLVFISIYALIVSHFSAAAGKSAKQEVANGD